MTRAAISRNFIIHTPEDCRILAHKPPWCWQKVHSNEQDHDRLACWSCQSSRRGICCPQNVNLTWSMIHGPCRWTCKCRSAAGHLLSAFTWTMDHGPCEIYILSSHVDHWIQVCLYHQRDARTSGAGWKPANRQQSGRRMALSACRDHRRRSFCRDRGGNRTSHDDLPPHASDRSLAQNRRRSWKPATDRASANLSDSR